MRLHQLWFDVLSADVCWLVDAVGGAGYSRDGAPKMPHNPRRDWVVLHTSKRSVAGSSPAGAAKTGTLKRPCNKPGFVFSCGSAPHGRLDVAAAGAVRAVELRRT